MPACFVHSTLSSNSFSFRFISLTMFCLYVWHLTSVLLWLIAQTLPQTPVLWVIIVCHHSAWCWHLLSDLYSQHFIPLFTLTKKYTACRAAWAGWDHLWQILSRIYRPIDRCCTGFAKDVLKSLLSQSFASPWKIRTLQGLRRSSGRTWRMSFCPSPLIGALLSGLYRERRYINLEIRYITLHLIMVHCQIQQRAYIICALFFFRITDVTVVCLAHPCIRCICLQWTEALYVE